MQIGAADRQAIACALESAASGAPPLSTKRWAANSRDTLFGGAASTGTTPKRSGLPKFSGLPKRSARLQQAGEKSLKATEADLLL